jgi:hypothetical protein
LSAVLSEINQVHCAIVTKIQIIRTAGLRTTPTGDGRVDASRMIAKTISQIEDCLADLQAHGYDRRGQRG